MTQVKETYRKGDTPPFSLPDGNMLDFITSVLRYNCILNNDYTIQSISDEFMRVLSPRGGNIRNQSLFEVIEDPENQLRDIIQKAFDGGIHMTGPLRVKGRRAQIIPVEALKIEMNGEPKILLFADNCFELHTLIEMERNERVKELGCMYRFASELEKATSIGELMTQVSRYINDSMQFAQISEVSISLDGDEYVAGRKKKKPGVTFSENLVVRGEKRGAITVGYREAEEILKEEYSLVRSIAKILGRAIERFEYAKKKDDYTHQLEDLIGERVREAEESRARYKALYENAPVGICVTTKEGEIVSANRELYRMFKYSEDKPARLHIIEDGFYCNPKDREKIMSELETRGFVSDCQVDMKASDGSIISVSLSSIRYEEDGTVYFETIMRDITEQKRLGEIVNGQQEALKEQVKKRTQALVRQRDKLIAMNRVCQETSQELRSSISKIQTLFNAITDPVISIDRDFKIQMSNQSNYEIGKTCHQVLFGSSRPCKRCPALRAIRYRKPASIEIEKGDGHFLLQCYPLLDSQGNVEGVIEWAKDITQERDIFNQMVQADRLASLGQLVSGIGHEINNPNTFILGNMKIISEACEDMLAIVDEYYKSHPDLRVARLDYSLFRDQIGILMEDMVNGALRIKTIVEDLKKFARKNDEKLADSVSINNIVESAIRLVQNQVKRKAIIETELGGNIPAINGNGLGIEQVIVNLLINAADAIKDGEKGIIQIKTVIDDSTENIIITVKDNGIGMSEATMKQLFNPFFTTKRACGGTGLGLSISYRIIKEHEGEIEVESTPGEGTTFRVYIPISTGNGEE